MRKKWIILFLLLVILIAGFASFLWSMRGWENNSDRLTLIVPFQLTLETHKLFEYLGLDKRTLLSELKLILRKEKAIQLVEYQKDQKQAYHVQIRLSHYFEKNREKKKTIPSKMLCIAQYRLTPIDLERDTLVFEEKIETHFDRKGFSKLQGHQRMGKSIRAVWSKGPSKLIMYSKARVMATADLLNLAEQQDSPMFYSSLRVLGERRCSLAIPFFIKLLEHKENTYVHTAIGFLVKLRAKDAVIPLIELTRGKDERFLAHIISALGEIGGEQAESYLYTLGAHTTPMIKESAKEALEEIHYRKKNEGRGNPLAENSLP